MAPGASPALTIRGRSTGLPAHIGELSTRCAWPKSGSPGGCNNLPGYRPCGITGTGDKAHQRAKAGRRRGADKVQSRNGSLEAPLQLGRAIEALKRRSQRRRQHRVAVQVDAITRRQDCPVDLALAAVIEDELETARYLVADATDRAAVVRTVASRDLSQAEPTGVT